MATARDFGALLNDYLPNEMLKETLIKRDYILQKCQKDETWRGGRIKVPFRGAGASTVEVGALAAANDISVSQFPVGYINDYVELWGSLLFKHRDLQEHSGGKIPEQTFLKILPDEVDQFIEYMRQVTSIQIGSGPHFATVTDDTNAATGVMEVDRVDRFCLGQKCVIDDNDSALQAVYVIAIDVNASTVTFSLTRGGAAANLSAYTVAQVARLYHPGVTDGVGNFTTFTSLRQALLPAAQGGASSLHGISKLAWPYLQAVAVSGSTITAANILDKLFDAYTEVRTKAKGNASTVLMSYKHLGSIMKLIETQKGPFAVSKQPSASLYGWTEIEITSVRGALTLVGIQEFDDDIIAFLDWSSFTFRTLPGMFKKRKSPDGLEYHEVRGTTGYTYIVDIMLGGEVEWTKPGHNGIIYGVNY